MSVCVADTISAISLTHRETPSQLLDQCRYHRTGKNNKIRKGYTNPTVKDTKRHTEITR